MLEVLARSYPVPRTPAQLATMARLTTSGGTFGTYLSDLRTGGYIEESDRGILISDAGRAAIGAPEHPPPMTREEVLEMWRGALRSGERKMLDVLAELGGTPITRAELAERTGFTLSGGTFGTYLSTLRTAGLADVDGDVVRLGEAATAGGTI